MDVAPVGWWGKVVKVSWDVNLGFAGAAGWGGEAGRQGKCRQHKAQQHKASQVCLLHYLPSVGSILGKVCVASVEISRSAVEKVSGGAGCMEHCRCYEQCCRQCNQCSRCTGQAPCFR